MKPGLPQVYGDTNGDLSNFFIVDDFGLEYVGKQHADLHYTRYPSTARGISLEVNDRNLDVRLTSDRPSPP